MRRAPIDGSVGTGGAPPRGGVFFYAHREGRTMSDEILRVIARVEAKVDRINETLHGKPDTRGIKSMVLDLWADRQARRKWWAGVKASVLVAAITAAGAWLWSAVSGRH